MHLRRKVQVVLFGCDISCASALIPPVGLCVLCGLAPMFLLYFYGPWYYITFMFTSV